MNVTPKRQAPCHPELPHYAKELCHPCWRETRRARIRVTERRRYWSDPEASRAKSRAKYANDPSMQLASKARYRKKNPEAVAARRRTHSLRTYGLTDKQYHDMLAAQNGCCALCQSNEPKGNGGRRFAVDHDHSTGRVRGLLCAQCNIGLGAFRDNIELLRTAIEYLGIELHPVLNIAFDRAK